MSKKFMRDLIALQSGMVSLPSDAQSAVVPSVEALNKITLKSEELHQKRKEEELIRSTRVRNIQHTYELNVKAMRERHDAEHAALERKQQLELERLKHDKDIRVNSLIRDSQALITRLFESVESSVNSHSRSASHDHSASLSQQLCGSIAFKFNASSIKEEEEEQLIRKEETHQDMQEDSINDIYDFVEKFDENCLLANHNNQEKKYSVLQQQQQNVFYPLAPNQLNCSNHSEVNHPEKYNSRNVQQQSQQSSSQSKNQKCKMELSKSTRSSSISTSSCNKENLMVDQSQLRQYDRQLKCQEGKTQKEKLLDELERSKQTSKITIWSKLQKQNESSLSRRPSLSINTQQQQQQQTSFNSLYEKQYPKSNRSDQVKGLFAAARTLDRNGSTTSTASSLTVQEQIMMKRFKNEYGSQESMAVNPETCPSVNSMKSFAQQRSYSGCQRSSFEFE